jgi:phosphohistidine swiveling domain-containing protein
MATQYVLGLRDKKASQHIGNKAKQLRFLIEKGFETPLTYVCTWDAYLRYRADDREIIEIIRSELSMLDLRRQYAIRSSSNIEDSLEHSFAGQFKTVLGAQGLDDIMQAIWAIWATTHSQGARAYLEKNGIDPHSLLMAVIVQELVSPAVAGVAFSKNPMTGMDEVVVEAVQGSGAALVQAGVTPERWIDKWGEWIARPEQGKVDSAIIREVVNQTAKIAKAYGAPVDLEWVYDGHTVKWVQLREITTLKNVNVYSNHIAREMLPGMIKPLVWSINVPLVNGQWVKLLTELIGRNNIDPNSLAKAFYYRTYFNMGTLGRIFESLGLPPEMLEMMMGVGRKGTDRPRFKPSTRTIKHLPRLIRFVADKLTFARKIKSFSPAMKAKYRAFRLDQVGRLSEQELLAEVDRIYTLTQDTAYFNVVAPLLMFLYDGLLRSQLQKIGGDVADFDVTSGVYDLQQFDPNAHLIRLNQAYCQLDSALQAAIATSSYEEFRQLSGINEFQRDVEQFVEQFGHLSDSGNDFTAAPWRENPDMILQMIVNCAACEDKLAGKVQFEQLRLSPVRRMLLGPIYRRARDFRLYREELSSLYTFGYGLFRPYFLALGDHLVRRGIIQSRDDIFYLFYDEVKDIVGHGCAKGDYDANVAARKREMELYRDIVVPSTICGDRPPPVDTQMGSKLEGIPTSRGYYTGPAKVVRGIRDFSKVREGDVLVIPYSDVGWTPLFTRAGAVIAESGGMLSHSSIVAREYNIPAVVSVSGAASLKDDLLVTVDGYKGEIIIHEHPTASNNPV